MRYHSMKKPDICSSMYGELYICNHPVYSRCTLFKIRDKGLAVISKDLIQRPKTCWTEVDALLVDQLYLNPKFKDYLINGLEHVKMVYTQLYLYGK